MIAAGCVSCVQLEYGARYLNGKLYPRGVRWFDYYSADLDDLLGPNLVMVLRSKRDLAPLLSAPKAAIPC